MCFCRVSGNSVMLFSSTQSATVLQHQRANSSQAFPLPPDVLEAAGLCQRRNILHSAHLWFQLVTVNNLFLKEPSTEGRVLVILLVLFQLLRGFYISQRKCGSIEPYRCAVLKQKARTVTDRWIWTVHIRGSYFMLVSLSEDTPVLDFPFSKYIAALVQDGCREQ